MLRLFTITLLFFPWLLSAQKSPTYLSFEVGGNGIVASANIGKTLITHFRYKVILQAGLGWTPKTAKSKYSINIPTQITCNFGQRNFFFEAGLGSSLILGSKLDKAENEPASSEIYLSPIVGFRHESENWFGRFYACPLFHVNGEGLYDDVTSDFINIGVSVGLIL